MRRCTLLVRTPSTRDKLMQFGRLIGSWDLDVIFYDETEKVTRRTPGERHFGWALEAAR